MKVQQLTGVVSVAVLACLILGAQDKYAVRVRGGLAFSEFRGYEGWQAISMSRKEQVVAVTLGNPEMIEAYRAGFPGNGKPVPDGAKMAKIHWTPKQNEFFSDATVPGALLNVDFMVKDSKRFTDSGVGAMPCSSSTPRPTRLSQERWQACLLRRTTPNAVSRATPSLRRMIMFSPSSALGDKTLSSSPKRVMTTIPHNAKERNKWKTIL